MNRAALLLCLLNFAFIGALPRIFFRPGSLNRNWWLTALPLCVTAALLLAGLSGAVRTTASPWPAAVLLAAASIALIGCTIGVHHVPLALWHQRDDRAAALVTHGPYRLVRHPFYAAFVLALLAAVAALPLLWTALCALLGMVQLRRTAVREELRLVVQFGAEYEAYMRRTGRFVPRGL
ncbi:MAG TPA: isoprenylcysteine carboxylmethyltransferase family protein [Longimicrobiales bacterium]|nr:isoprenylcysteine carboxylmethyltransferase family protein [Longimicrobiales bacterium]